MNWHSSWYAETVDGYTFKWINLCKEKS